MGVTWSSSVWTDAASSHAASVTAESQLLVHMCTAACERQARCEASVQVPFAQHKEACQSEWSKLVQEYEDPPSKAPGLGADYMFLVHTDHS